MSLIRSFAVGNGDTYCIVHNSDNFTMIDCCLAADRRDEIIAYLQAWQRTKSIARFISTHPDEDHIRGLADLDDALALLNFYCVANEATKDSPTESFERYVLLRDDESKAFNLHKGCARRWMNLSNEKRKTSGLSCLWPDTSNPQFQHALEEAAGGGSPNNISPILTYSVAGGATAMWMGDLETDFMKDIEELVDIPRVDILFAPHHGRSSGRVPGVWLDKLSPELVVIGEAPSKDLDYYGAYNTITQNSAGDVEFHCKSSVVHIYVSSGTYSVDFLRDNDPNLSSDLHYLGTLDTQS